MIFILGFVAAFVTMEFIAWSAHKYLMHGFLWKVHRDHHQPTGRTFQRNDLFFLIFAIPAWQCIMLGFIFGSTLSIGIGFGISLYGVIYFLVHEVLIHRRFNWLDNANNNYFEALKKGHRAHHEFREKEDGVCFGLLVVPKVYWRR
ncbi:MAG: sterol desaturase family protein [Crocinitomicaceae bacterium]|nr:sterol desaturase family protein [Crocinitomicaceae bacterium]